MLSYEELGAENIKEAENLYIRSNIRVRCLSTQTLFIYGCFILAKFGK
jgi:hypothetical protein